MKKKNEWNSFQQAFLLTFQTNILNATTLIRIAANQWF